MKKRFDVIMLFLVLCVPLIFSMNKPSTVRQGLSQIADTDHDGIADLVLTKAAVGPIIKSRPTKTQQEYFKNNKK